MVINHVFCLNINIPDHCTLNHDQDSFVRNCSMALLRVLCTTTVEYSTQNGVSNRCCQVHDLHAW